MISSPRVTGERWELWLPVSPVPASRPRIPRWGKPYYTGRYQEYRKAAEAALEAMVDLPEPRCLPVDCTLEFVVQRPKSPSNPWPRGDLDNYEKAFYDAVSGKTIIADDAYICRHWAEKRYTTDPEKDPAGTLWVVTIAERFLK